MHTIVIAFEIFDNIPHNKVSRCPHMREMLQYEVLKAVSSTAESMGERFGLSLTPYKDLGGDDNRTSV